MNGNWYQRIIGDSNKTLIRLNYTVKYMVIERWKSITYWWCVIISLCIPQLLQYYCKYLKTWVTELMLRVSMNTKCLTWGGNNVLPHWASRGPAKSAAHLLSVCPRRPGISLCVPQRDRSLAVPGLRANLPTANLLNGRHLPRVVGSFK